MTRDEYINEYERIDKGIKVLRDQIYILQKEYLSHCKYKVGDKVKLTLYSYGMNMNEPDKEVIAYVLYVGYGMWGGRDIKMEFSYPKKNGEMSLKDAHIPWTQIKNIEKIS